MLYSTATTRRPTMCYPKEGRCRALQYNNLFKIILTNICVLWLLILSPSGHYLCLDPLHYVLNRQSSSEACVGHVYRPSVVGHVYRPSVVGHVYRPSVYTVGVEVHCIQPSSYNLITRLWILLQCDTHPMLL